MGIRKRLCTALICAAIGSMALAAQAGATVLYDQNSGGSGNGYFSISGGTGTSELADDFIVPAGQTWTVRGIDVTGAYDAGSTGPINGINVRFYASTGVAPSSLPTGSPIFEQLNITPANGLTGPSFSIPVNGAVLPGGAGTEYWLSVQANLPDPNIWDWQNRGPLSLSPAAARTSVIASCMAPAWNYRFDPAHCQGGDATSPDQMFSLSDVAPAGPAGTGGGTTTAPGNPTSPINPAGHLRKRKCKKAKKRHATAAKKKKCGKKRH